MLVMLLALIASSPAAEPSPSPDDVAVMTVDGRPITQAMVATATARVPTKEMEVIKASGTYGRFLEQLALTDALYHEAVDDNLALDREAALRIELARREVLADLHLRRIGDDAVTEEAVAAAYEARAVQFSRPQVHARHILVKDRELAADLVRQLTAKKARHRADFATLAAKHSLDPKSKDNGGDLGWFTAGRMLKGFSDAAFAAEPGTVVGPVETRVGFHVIEVLERTDRVPLEQVRGQLEEEIREAAVKEAIERTMGELDCRRIDPDGASRPCSDR